MTVGLASAVPHRLVEHVLHKVPYRGRVPALLKALDAPFQPNAKLKKALARVALV